MSSFAYISPIGMPNIILSEPFGESWPMNEIATRWQTMPIRKGFIAPISIVREIRYKVNSADQFPHALELATVVAEELGENFKAYVTEEGVIIK